MRLRWPFSHGTPGEGPAPSATGADPAPGSAAAASLSGVPASGAPGSTFSPPTGAWSTLPPIQRALGAAPVVAPSKPFLAGVPGHTPLPPIVQPLGHERAATAPPGLLVAHVSPVPSLTSSAPLATRPVQRHPASAPAGRDRAEAWPEPPPPESPAQQAMHGALPAEPAPVRTLAPVAPAATVTPPARSLTHAAASPTPIVPPAARRPAAAGSAPASPGVQRAAAGDGAAGRTSSLPMPRNVSRWAEAGARTAASTLRAPEVAAPTSTPAASTPPGPASGPRTTGDADSRSGNASGGSRRPGLGAPISAAPTSAVAERLPLHAPPRPGASGQPSAPPVPDASRRLAGGTGNATIGGAAADAGGALDDPTGARGPLVAQRTASRPASLPILPVARRRHEADSPRPGAESSVAAGPGRSDRRTTLQGGPQAPHAAAASSIAPLIGARPLRPTVQRRAAPVGAEAAEAATGSGAGAIPAPVVPARWTRDDDLPPTVISSARRPTMGDPATVPLLPAGLTAGAATEPAHDSGPREIVFPPRDGMPGPGPEPAGPAFPSVVQRAAAAPAVRRGASDAEPGGARHGGWAGPDTGRAPATAGNPALTLARSAAVGPAAERRLATGGGQPVPSGAVTPAPPVQASRDSGASGLPDITAIPVVQRVDGAAPAAPSEDGQSDSELDELAQALFGRIRGRLRAEVIHEREARGLTFDAF